MEDKSIYTNRRHNRHKNSQENKQKKNLFIENNDGDEVKNILEFNESIKKSLPDYGEIDIIPKKEKKKRFNLNFKSSKLKYSLGLMVLVAALFGTSYSFFNYRKVDSRQADISAGEVYVRLVENATSISLPKMYPRTDEEARARNDNYFDFTIKGKNTSDTKSILYTINVEDGEAVSGKTRINPQYIKVDLQQKVGQDYNYIAEGVKLSDFSYTGTIPYNTASEITKEYRIRFWISDDVIISDTDPNATYTATQFSNLFATYDISVSSEDKATLYDKILKNVSQTYIASYQDVIDANPGLNFTTQDQVSTSSVKQTVYYYTGDDAEANANVIFAGFCWQIVRTTDNGGVRMIYNGVAVDNKCETTRTATKGINADGNGTTQTMSAASRYGRSFDYDLTTGEFIIEDSTGLPTSWSTSDNNSNGTEDYKELIGTYTCLSNSDTCTTLYYVGSIRESNTAQAYVSKYTIGDVAHFSQMGTSAFNPNYYSPAMVGYMFNTEYDYKYQTKSGEYYTTATWNGTTYDLTSSNNGSAPDVEHHYICDTDCTKVRYYYYSTNYYILLENGTTVEDAIYKMTGNGTVETKSKTNNANYELNNYNSAMKGYLDNWYKKNLTGYTSFLDGTSVYCNDRSIRELGGWNPTNSPSLTTTLQFYQYSANRDLNCVNETDRFAVTNNKAELTYPIGLLTEPERNLMTANFAKTGQYYWGASPIAFYYLNASVRPVDTTGDTYSPYVNFSLGARGVITLKPGTKLEKGTGTYNNPYVVKVE